MHYILETERLRLRPFTLTDTLFIVELVNSPGWIKYIGDRNIRTELQARQYLKNGPLKSYQVNGFGLSMVESKIDGIPIGMCGILKRDHLDTPDIGFAFLPAFMGKGFAFEIASAILTYAEDILEIPSISGVTVASNISSVKLLEKIGMKFIRTITFPNETKELLLYSK